MTAPATMVTQPLRRQDSVPRLRLVPGAGIEQREDVICGDCDGSCLDAWGCACKLCRGAGELTVRTAPCGGEFVALVDDSRGRFVAGCHIGWAETREAAFQVTGGWGCGERLDLSNPTHREALAVLELAP